MSALIKACFISLTLASSFAIANEWSTSAGLNLRNAESTEPAAGYKDRGWSANTSLTKQIGDWNFGGALSYSLSTLDEETNSARNKPKVTSGVAMTSLDLGGGRTMSATLGYGKNSANASEITGGNTITHTSKSDFLSTSVGLTQSLSLSRRSMAIFSARYTQIRSDQKAYTDSAGTNTPGTRSGFGFTTVGVGYSHRFGRYTPYIQADWNTSNKAFVANDRDYFNINAGINYRVNAKTSIGASFSTVVDKSYTRDNTLGVSVRHDF